MKPAEAAPEPGQYDGYIKGFGSDVKGISMGGKYQTSYDPTLGPGTYDAAGAIDRTMSRSRSAKITEPEFKRPKAE